MSPEVSSNSCETIRQ